MWRVHQYYRTVGGRRYGPFTVMVRKRPQSKMNDYVYLGKIRPESVDLELINELWGDEPSLPTRAAILGMK